MQKSWDSNLDSFSGFYKSCLLRPSLYDLHILLKPIMFVFFRGQYNLHFAKNKPKKSVSLASCTDAVQQTHFF